MQVILVPDLIFLIFLAYTARRCYDILTRSPSMIMWTYYCLVWAVTVANVLRTAVQLASSSGTTSHVFLWNVLWLFTRLIMTTLEVRASGPSATPSCCSLFACSLARHGRNVLRSQFSQQNCMRKLDT